MPESEQRPPIATAPISAIFPVANAEPYLQRIVEDWVAHLGGLERDYEILLVDDGSTDHTPALAEKLASQHKQVQVHRHPSPRGLGAALRTGIALARYPLVLYNAEAYRYQPSDLKAMLKWIDRVDLVCGYRIRSDRSWRRRWTERLFRWWVRFLFAVRLWDIDCWYVLARRSLLSRVRIQCDGHFAHAEILAKVNFLEGLMTEVRVSYHPVPEAGGQHALTLRQKLAGAWNLFFHPDFRPVPQSGPLPSGQPG
jgi:glycosyltransferase involved in cell wall biosynthesis